MSSSSKKNLSGCGCALLAVALIYGSIVDWIDGDDAPPATTVASSTAATTTPTSPSLSPENKPAPEPTSELEQAVPLEQAGGYYQLLSELEVKGRAPKTGYDRDEFGQRWSDDVTVEFGHDGCDTRNNILTRDLTAIEFRPGTHGCVVESGYLADPYSGAGIDFHRGRDTSSAVHIDHVVALSDAWQKGAQFWDPATRENFANDPRNLLAVDGGLNMQKGDGDAATWLPPNAAFRCDYAQRIIEVKHAYGVWVTPAEQRALQRQLDSCQAP